MSFSVMIPTSFLSFAQNREAVDLFSVIKAEAGSAMDISE